MPGTYFWRDGAIWGGHIYDYVLLSESAKFPSDGDTLNSIISVKSE